MTVEDYEKEIKALKAEIKQLKNGPKLLPFDSVGWVNSAALGGDGYVIAGPVLKEAIMAVGGNGNVCVEWLDDIISDIQVIKDWLLENGP